MMLFALLLLAGIPDWVPARWSSSDTQSLELVRRTPINCLLLEQRHWSAEFTARAAEAGIATLGVVRPGDQIDELACRVAAARLAGVVLEGDFEPPVVARLRQELADSRLVAVELPSRVRMRLDENLPVVGTWQGVWPGINAQEDGAAKAAPSGAPWIDTNTGFLRFVRAVTDATVWIGVTPPPKTVLPTARYLQAIGDAAIAGARWILALDDDSTPRLLAREPAALAGWDRIALHLRYFEQHRQWRGWGPHGQLALVQDVTSGSLFSGAILDMIATKHTPVRAVPVRKLSEHRMQGAKMAVNVDPAALAEAEKETLRRFTRAGGTLLTAPPGWKFPVQQPDQITLPKEDVEKLDAIWRDVNSMTGRRNLGVRLFNVSSMVSHLLAAPSGSPLLVHLVNYSDHAVESVALLVPGKVRQATVFEPGVPPRRLTLYDHEEGTGIELERVTTLATVLIE